MALVGPGAVGSALLEQLRIEAPRLHSRFGIDLRVVGITNSRQMLLSSKDHRPLDLSRWQDALLEDGADASLGVLTGQLS